MKKVNKGLREAAKKGDEAGLKNLLLRPGCDPMTKDDNGWTVLMHATWSGHIACVNLLLPVSDALAKDNHGETALMYAASNGQTSCTEQLIPVSDALAKNNGGMTASDLASNQGHNSLSEFIDAYTLALGEMSEFGSSIPQAAPRAKTSLRV